MINWGGINSFSEMLFPVKTTIVSVGMDQALEIASTAPRAWWDQRGIIDAMDPEQPQHLDFTDLHLLGWREPGR
jgi:hypothetical protein